MKTSVIFALATAVVMLLGGLAAGLLIGPRRASPASASTPVAAANPAATEPAATPPNTSAAAAGTKSSDKPVAVMHAPTSAVAKSATSAATASLTGNTSGTFRAQANDIVRKMQAKINQGANTEAAFAPELKQLDALLAANKDSKPSETAELAMLRAGFYLQILDDPEKGLELIKQLAADYPGTEEAREAALAATEIEPMIAGAKIRKSLVVGAEFPDFSVKDLAGKPLSLADYKGKVVLVDFWATWCPGCLIEMPDVQEAYAKYHAKGFDVLGISLDQERPRLESFLKQEKIPWRQFFDGKGWQNELAVKYGVQAIPASYLLGRDGRILAVSPHGPELDAAIAKALAAK